MPHKSDTRSHLLKSFILFAMTAFLLFFDFYSNSWHMADQQWFESYQKDCQSLVVGRMVKSRQDGIFSAGGLPGVGGKADFNRAWLTEEQVENQYLTYFHGKGFQEYSPYMSQSGGQAIFFSFLDDILPLDPQEKLRLFNALTSILTASALGLIVLWFYSEFGLTVAVFVAVSMMLSQWLTVFGRNLWWSIWGFYIPVIAVMFYLKKRQYKFTGHFLTLGSIVFMALIVKYFFTGFEYITTTLIMMTVPFVYYVIKNKLDKLQIIKGSISIILASGFSIVICLFVLSMQIASVKGSFSKGYEHIVQSLEKRTHGSAEDHPGFSEGLNASTIEVCARYMIGAFASFNNFFSTSNKILLNFILKIHYLYLLALFLAVSAYVYPGSKQRGDDERHKERTLVLVTWFSMLAPLSWFVIFKEHSYDHFHMNYIVWQMPFTFFGFAICGVAAKRFFSRKERNAGS